MGTHLLRAPILKGRFTVQCSKQQEIERLIPTQSYEREFVCFILMIKVNQSADLKEVSHITNSSKQVIHSDRLNGLSPKKVEEPSALESPDRMTGPDSRIRESPRARP